MVPVACVYSSKTANETYFHYAFDSTDVVDYHGCFEKTAVVKKTKKPKQEGSSKGNRLEADEMSKAFPSKTNYRMEVDTPIEDPL